MVKAKFQEPKLVLMFNAEQILVTIAGSLHLAAEHSGCNIQAVSFACKGDYIQAGGYYFRFIPDDIEVFQSDIRKLKLQDYDELCKDTDRKYLPVREMKKLKTNKRNKNKQDDHE